MAQTISIIDVILAKALAISASKAYTDQKTQSLMGGVHYRGQVDYYDNLPNDPEEGDSYTVKYAGSSGTVADGTEYTWGIDSSTHTLTWISFSKDAYSKAETDLLLAAKADEDNVYKLALTDADLLPANTDLDDVKTVGCYYAYLSGDVSSIINRPVTSTNAFRLTVYYSAGKNRPRQTYRAYNSYDTYERISNSSGAWSSWKKVEADLSTKQDTISDLSTIRSGAALGATAVQPETGKGLSTNDYTTAEKTKLAGIIPTDIAQITTNKNNILTLYEEGVINLVDTDDKTGSTWINIPIELPAGNYVLHFDTLSSTASGTTCQTVFFAADNSEASRYIYPTRGNNITFDVTVTKTTSYLRIYAGDSYDHSTDFTVEFTNLLVAKKESWEASSKVYQPYAMTNSELTAAIKALRAQLANQ